MVNVDFLVNYIPAELATVLISTLPIIELRGAIPVAIGAYKLSAGAAFFWAVLGNMIPAFLILFFIEKISVFLMKRYDWAQKFFNWLFERSRKKFDSHYQKHGSLALLLFVAIPLPMTGVWTASLAAFLIGIKSRVAVPYLLAGVLIAGFIVTGISIGIF